MVAYLKLTPGPRAGDGQLGDRHRLRLRRQPHRRHPPGLPLRKTPDLVVVETRYREAFQYLQTAEPQVAQCIGRYLQQASPPVAFGPDYVVYATRVNAPGR